MKKHITMMIFVFLAVLCITFEIGDLQIVSATEFIGDECDEIIINNIKEISTEYYSTDISFVATKEPLYDVSLVQFGLVYDFVINGEPGYAILVNTNGVYEMAELFFSAKNPYSNVGKNEYRVYARNMVYLRCYNGDFFVAETNEPVSEYELNIIRNYAFYASSEITITASSESISFISKQENKKDLATRYPALFEVANYPNACGPIAGAGIIQYWDRFSTNLIPDFTPFAKIGNSYLYKEANDTLNSVVVQLYQDMGTNTIKPGTSITQFVNGLSAYCARQGYGVVYNSCMTNGTFDFSKSKNFIDAGQPLVLFLDTFNITSISSGDNEDNISYINGIGCHAMAGYGYKEIDYVLTGNVTRSDRYIAVGSGMSVRKRGYFNINYHTQIDDAFSISIS